MYVKLALAFGWSKSQVDAEEDDYVRELLVALDAHHDVTKPQKTE